MTFQKYRFSLLLSLFILLFLALIQNTNWTDGVSGASVTLGTSLGLNAYEYRILVK